MKVFAGEKSKYFAEQVCKFLEVPLGSSVKTVFSDGEFISTLNETVRGQNVYLICSTFQPESNLFELLQMADASKRAGAKSIIAVVPYMSYSRSDKKDAPRTPITAALVGKIIESSGINHLVTMDLHNNSIEGMYNIPVSHIFSSSVIAPSIIEKNFDKNLIVVSPDMGGTKKAKIYSQFLRTDMAICYKHREKANEIKEMRLIGAVKGRHVLIVDDIADTCSTICECANLLMSNGALSVKAAVAHPVLSGNSYKKISESMLDELIVTNSIPLKSSEKFVLGSSEAIGLKKITVVNVCGIFANVIKNIENNMSISANF